MFQSIKMQRSIKAQTTQITITHLMLYYLKNDLVKRFKKQKCQHLELLFLLLKEGQIIACYYHPVGLESDVTSKRFAAKTCMISIRFRTILMKNSAIIFQLVNVKRISLHSRGFLINSSPSFFNKIVLPEISNIIPLLHVP